MKKALFCLITIILLSVNANAQYKPFQFGLKFAPNINITKVNCDKINGGLKETSINWGFFGNFYFVENYGFSTGFNINNIKGGYTYNSGNIKRTFKNQYLEIPLSLVMRTEKIGKIRITGNIGYGMGICLTSELKDINVKTEKEIESINEFGKIRHALIIKLGIEYNLYKSSCLLVAFSYNNNFANIYKKDNSLGHDFVLNNLCLEIGFMF